MLSYISSFYFLIIRIYFLIIKTHLGVLSELLKALVFQKRCLAKIIRVLCMGLNVNISCILKQVVFTIPINLENSLQFPFKSS